MPGLRINGVPRLHSDRFATSGPIRHPHRIAHHCACPNDLPKDVVFGSQLLDPANAGVCTE
jgi:hypothetical protein